MTENLVPYLKLADEDEDRKYEISRFAEKVNW